MNRISGITPWAGADIGGEIDLFLAAIGYEARSRFITENHRPAALRSVAFGFHGQKVMSYRVNQKCFRSSGVEVRHCDDLTFQKECEDLFQNLPEPLDRSTRICIDISSMSRLRIAAVLSALAELGRHRQLVAEFVYAVAKYSPPPKELKQIVSAGPVLPQYAGWSTEPDQPVAAIFGLGYEYDKAVGTLEFIEPAQVWAFKAVSRDSRYDAEAQRANTFLWKMLPSERVIEYHVERPFDCFVSLESLLFGVLQSCRPVLIPFGPKIFTLCCLLAATVHSPKVAVWRVSSGENEPPVDRAADGNVVGMRVQFAPPIPTSGPHSAYASTSRSA
jgi:hypothetical protein